MMAADTLMEILSFPQTFSPYRWECYSCLYLSLPLSFPSSSPYSSVSLRPGDGGWHHPRLWHHSLQLLVWLYRGQTWKVGYRVFPVLFVWLPFRNWNFALRITLQCSQQSFLHHCTPNLGNTVHHLTVRAEHRCYKHRVLLRSVWNTARPSYAIDWSELCWRQFSVGTTVSDLRLISHTSAEMSPICSFRFPVTWH